MISDLDCDPYDVSVDQDNSVYVSSEARSAVWKISQTDGGSWTKVLHAGTGAVASRAQPKDGNAEACSFSGVRGLAVLPTGRTVFALDALTSSLCKIVDLSGWVKFATARRTALEAFGERGPSLQDPRPVRSWHEILPSLVSSAAVLDGIYERRAEATGYASGQGGELTQDRNSLHAHTKLAVSSMVGACQYTEELDSRVAEMLDARACTEKDALTGQLVRFA